jgi:hypothetical protein
MSVLAAPPDERRLGRTAPDLNACTGPQCMHRISMHAPDLNACTGPQCMHGTSMHAPDSQCIMPQARHLSQVLHGEHTDRVCLCWSE